MKTPVLAIILACLMAGCTTAPSQEGVPNLAQVSEYVYRGGQPDAAGWDTLKAMGIKTVIKLNGGSDPGATARGMKVICLPISTADETVGKPDNGTVQAAVSAIYSSMARGEKVYVHCTHGQDRTGLIIGIFEVSCGMSKEDAYAEMKRMGFHPHLRGLYWFWEEDVQSIR
jgi:protein tyrosine/serine phosphatase